MHSMTGFGRALLETPFGQLLVEIQSVNRKHLDISTFLPPLFTPFETEIRKWISEEIERGQVTVRVRLHSQEQQLPDLAFLQALKVEWKKRAQALQTPSEEITLSFLLQHAGNSSPIETASEEHLVILKKCVKLALKSLLQMKKTEGEALLSDLTTRLAQLVRNIDTFEREAPIGVKRLREKLQQRILDLFPPGIEAEERVLREAALLAEKADITEEVTRLRSHCNQFLLLLQSKENKGRKFDFLIQEMARETNTIGAKSTEIGAIHLVVEMKGELEKMREQVQNLE